MKVEGQKNHAGEAGTRLMVKREAVVTAMVRMAAHNFRFGDPDFVRHLGLVVSLPAFQCDEACHCR